MYEAENGIAKETSFAGRRKKVRLTEKPGCCEMWGIDCK